MKKAYLISFILCTIIGWMIIGWISQKNKDNQFKTKCENNPSTHTSLTFAIDPKEESHQINVLLKNKQNQMILNKIVSENEDHEFTYDGGFSIDDTLMVIKKSKTYKIYGFKYHTVIINEKKGPECQYKGAFFNGKWNEDDVFDLN